MRKWQHTVFTLKNVAPCNNLQVLFANPIGGKTILVPNLASAIGVATQRTEYHEGPDVPNGTSRITRVSEMDVPVVLNVCDSGLHICEEMSNYAGSIAIGDTTDVIYAATHDYLSRGEGIGEYDVEAVERDTLEAIKSGLLYCRPNGEWRLKEGAQ